ncbi:putative phosphonate transport system ATP-binding protein [Crenobacter luteus]|uniref:Phosphonate C-P lyase system protein PhnK n=1 Tax=Crenobacter luteus TaxID=1452487 RepID=A0A163CEL2_9NEIS|nr:phosphonate C-P lyase system protein PhnK [Crenobacter luteus]KZE31681.1 phosphonate C-P lyase system protein PhnK [Crenobacter luteus]TCP15543.1 putative phosphonate transport system ATP-binding protein [Crenobacter luteus]
MKPILQVKQLAKRYGDRYGCRDVNFELYEGEVLCIVGESGSGKSTLLATLAGRLAADEGEVTFRDANGDWHELSTLAEAERRRLARTEWGFVTQHARDGLRMGVSAGANVSERLMALGHRHYGQLRATAAEWLEKVEIGAERLDDPPSRFSGGMQQRLQIARNLVTRPRLVFMDEPTGGLDVSVQARFLDLLRRLVHESGVAVIMVTHDLGVARLLAHRTLVMQQGRVVEAGLTDQILDDPQHPYTQLLVSSIVQA